MFNLKLVLAGGFVILAMGFYIQTSRLSEATERAAKAEKELADSEAYTQNLIATIDENQLKQKELNDLSNKLKKGVHSAPDTDIECFIINNAFDGLHEHQTQNSR